MTFAASAGHSCGLDFKAAEFLRQHPEFSWLSSLLRDMDSERWTLFTIAK
jgi:hypothetical protein